MRSGPCDSLQRVARAAEPLHVRGPAPFEPESSSVLRRPSSWHCCATQGGKPADPMLTPVSEEGKGCGACDAESAEDLLQWERDVAARCEAQKQARPPPKPRDLASSLQVANTATWTARTVEAALRKAKRAQSASRMQHVPSADSASRQSSAPTCDGGHERD